MNRECTWTKAECHHPGYKCSECPLADLICDEMQLALDITYKQGKEDCDKFLKDWKDDVVESLYKYDANSVEEVYKYGINRGIKMSDAISDIAIDDAVIKLQKIKDVLHSPDFDEDDFSAEVAHILGEVIV